MALPKLFIQKEKSLEKEAAYRLSGDCDSWEQEITEKLHEEHPYLPEYDITVKLRKTDEISGAGVGQITIDDTIRIPVIVDDYKLQPLDLMYYDGKLLPISKRSLDNITHKGTLGRAVKPHSMGGDMGLRTATQAPHQGKYALATVLTFSAEDLSDALTPAYQSREAMLYDLKDCRVLREGIQRYAENVGVIKEAAAEPVKLELVENAPLKNITSGGVVTMGGRGFMCKQASFDGHLLSSNVFIGVDGRWSPTESVPGASAQVKLAGIVPTKSGVFVAKVGDEYVATEPVQVLFKTAEYCSVRTALGNKYRIYRDASYNNLEKIASNIYMSEDWMFVPTDRKVDFSSAEDLNKIAEAGSAIRVQEANGLFMIQGDVEDVPELAKIANSFVTRNEAERGFSALCSPDMVANVLQQAHDYEAAKIRKYVPQPDGSLLPEDEIPKLAQADLNALIKSIGMMTDDVIKQAEVGETEAAKTVDAVLGLNFLNQQNIDSMLESIDELEVGRAILTRILLAGRMGLDVDTKTLHTAVFALDAVIKDLRRVRQSQLAD